MKQLANKCPKLKRLELDFNIGIISILVFKQHLSPLKAFPSLKRSDVNLPVLSIEYLPKSEEFSFKTFEGLSNSTHLSLRFNGKPLNDSVLKDIDTYLPNLRYLDIKSSFTTNSTKGIKRIVNILCRLSRLKTIVLRFKSNVNYQQINEEISVKCARIRTIDIDS